MLQRIIQKLRLLYLRSSVGSFDKFLGLNPFYSGVDQRVISENREKLRPVYEQYVREVSSPDMAASLELTVFLYTLCAANRYTRLLDLGSGLSSFAFRLYARETPGVTVFSVDDDEKWLMKTRDFLSTHKVGTENMMTLEQFLVRNESGFDCILHDLNFVEVRIKYVERILPMINQSGLIIFDDVHKPDYLIDLLAKLTHDGGQTCSLQPTTRDRFGRFSLAYFRSL